MNQLQEKYKSEIVGALREKFQYKSVMQVPGLEKISLNVGIGDAATNPKALEAAVEELGLITGQRAVRTKAKKSIAGFKLREGMAIGCRVTLRGQRMYEFLFRLINIAIPRVRDFRGLNPNGFDGRGNYNFSIREQIIFPEINVDQVDSYHGLNVTVATTATTDEEGRELLTALGFPFRKS
ncbi:MAG: 50S ribosomal protein L5 [Leptospiraceae bacterium]|nr:50S ribosomal protein L5 [Leptospiraceae bacterium]MCB1302928.1 50S ribosomal protein L5 [Leptospiraceae bacterium]